MKRRDFIGGAAATVLTTAGRMPAQTSDGAKLSRIAVMMFGLNNIVRNNMPPSPTRTLDIMDIGQLCADRFHVHNVELQSNYFPSTEMSWLKDFKSRVDKTKTRIVQINLEFGTGIQLDADSPSGRLQMIDLHRAWLDKAAFLGCPRVLVNQGRPSQEKKELIISNYAAIVKIAKTKGIKVASENRGGPAGGRGRGANGPGGTGVFAQSGRAAEAATSSAPPVVPQASDAPGDSLLVEILKAGGAYGCCDFLNFSNQSEQLEGIRTVLPITSGLVHAGMRFDLPKAMTVVRELGYKGIYSIKALGLPGDPLDNTQKILDGVLENM